MFQGQMSLGIIKRPEKHVIMKKPEPILNGCLYKQPNSTPSLYEISLIYAIFYIALTFDIFVGLSQWIGKR